MNERSMSFIPNTHSVESVTSGHPDKVCDQISDAIVDACISQDPDSRVAVECFGGHGKLNIGGEVTTTAQVNYEDIARQVYGEIGYMDPLEIEVNISEQSPDIAMGVNPGGAGDQGIMYGYATGNTVNFMPESVNLAHQLTQSLQRLRDAGDLDWLGPDGKAQVTYIDRKLHTVLVSAQHDADMTIEDVREIIRSDIIEPLTTSYPVLDILVNPTGRFVRGGFDADTGLTGRKIMVDSYGGLILHGGGCFSGKDATKVDRSGAYMARFVAKNIVANQFASECLVSVAYSIGISEPLMVSIINEKGEQLAEKFAVAFDFRPQAIIERLQLKRPIYRKTATYGHFGKEGDSWEEIISL